VLGVSHAVVGAYLLGIWGLPLSLVEIAAYHHDPGSSESNGSAVLAAVHVADALVDAASASSRASEPSVDLDFLARSGLADRWPIWRSMAEREMSSTFASAGAASAS
jgi:HD-like signal output (HDOD) protein